MKVVPLYAALFALFFIVLSVRVIVLRYKFQVPLGDGDYPQLSRSMRVHANFAEYVPFALLLLWMLESYGVCATCLHALCGVLLAARLSHAFGVGRVSEKSFLWRGAGMVGTFGVLTVSALALICKTWA